MINLLPPEAKRQTLAGISNTLLLRYCIISLLLTIPLILLAVGSYLVIMNAKNTAEKTISDSEAKSAEYADVQAQAKTFRDNLAVAKNVLGNEIKYSKIAIAIAQGLPTGMALDNLDLDVQSFGQPITLELRGESYNDAITLKNRLEASETFQDVHILSVTTNDEGGGVTVALSAVINPEVAKQ